MDNSITQANQNDKQISKSIKRFLCGSTSDAMTAHTAVVFTWYMMRGQMLAGRALLIFFRRNGRYHMDTRISNAAPNVPVYP